MPTKISILWAMPTLRICSKNQIVTLYIKIVCLATVIMPQIEQQ